MAQTVKTLVRRALLHPHHPFGRRRLPSAEAVASSSAAAATTAVNRPGPVCEQRRRPSSTLRGGPPSLRCWKCGIERRHIVELFCERCRSIQSPDGGAAHNYFRLFGLDERFALDRTELARKHREMQAVLHPDKFANRSEQERKISEEFSSLVNKAYNVLQSPLSRAIHLLKLHGEEIGEDQKVDDPDFLMEIMELNEEVESAHTEERLRELEQKNGRMLATVAGNIENCFKAGDVGGARNQIVKMRYYSSVGGRIHALLRERGIVD